MAMFNSYVKLPEGTPTLGNLHDWICLKKDPGNTPKIHWLIIMNSENLSTPRRWLGVWHIFSPR